MVAPAERFMQDAVLETAKEDPEAARELLRASLQSAKEAVDCELRSTHIEVASASIAFD